MRARRVADRFCAAVSSRFSCSSLAAVSLAILATATCRADDTGPTLDGGDTAWMIVATALVLFMTLPWLVAITPASGTAGPLGAIALGSISAIVCYWAATSVKHRFRYDDSLDVFGVHGVGGVVGAVLTGVVAAPALGGSGLAHESIASQVWWQTASVLVTAAWSGVVSVVAFLLVDRLVGMRASREVEQMGLDLSEHQEQAYEIV